MTTQAAPSALPAADGSSVDAPSSEGTIKGSAERDQIMRYAAELGFDVVRISAAQLADQTRNALERFLELGHHGEMGWMADTQERRGDPTVLWPEARSVLMVGLNYGPTDDPLTLLERKERGAVSVYARNSDYHDVLKKRLKALGRWMAAEFGCELKVFVDTAPVMEKPLAQQAGLGWQGKHSNLVSRDFGSWLFLGALFTTLDLPVDDPVADHCGSCQRCLDICPTKAFPEPYKVDARRCISYLTIEHKGPIPHEFRTAMGNRIYGCDDCLAVCPWNRFAQQTKEYAFQPRLELNAPTLDELAQLDDAGFRQVFAGSPIKRTGRNRFVRNVLIAIGNSGEETLSVRAEALLEDESPLVRGAAVWALGQLHSQTECRRILEPMAKQEQDLDVTQEIELLLQA